MKTQSTPAKYWTGLASGAVVFSFTLYVSLAATLAILSDDLPHFDHAVLAVPGVMAVFAGSVPVIMILVCAMDAVFPALFGKLGLSAPALDALSFATCICLVVLFFFFAYADVSDGLSRLFLLLVLLAALAGGIARYSVNTLPG